MTKRVIILQFFLPICLLLLGLIVFMPGHSHAITENTNDIPWFEQGFDKNCNGYKHYQDEWISKAGDNTVTTVDVPGGADSVNLQINFLTANCNTNLDGSGNIVDKRLVQTRVTNTNDVWSTHGSVSPGLKGQVLDIDGYGWSYFWNDRYVKWQPADKLPNESFTLSGLSDLAQGTYTIKVHVGSRWVHKYTRSDGTSYYICVEPNPDGTPDFASGLDDTHCRPAGPEFPVTINIQSKPPVGSVDSANCDSLDGWAFDYDNPFAYLTIHVYIDGTAGSGAPGYAYSPAVPPYPNNPGFPRAPNYDEYEVRHRPDVEAAYHQGDYHGFKIDLKPYADAYSHTYYVYALDATGTNHKFLGTRSAGPCAPPTCVVTANPQFPQVGQDFDLVLTYNYSPGSRGQAIDPDGSVRLDTGPNSSTYHFPSSKVGNNHAWGPYSRSTAGNFPVYGSITQPGKFTKNCDNNGDSTQGVRISVNPYLRIYGNDVQAGAKFADASDSCTASALVNPKATALAFDDPIPTNNGSHSNDFIGAGTQFATFALGEISHFFSASQHTPRANTSGSTKTTPNNDLTFGNYNPNYSISKYGAFTGLDTTKVVNYGGVSGQIHCIPGFAYKKASIPGPYTVNTTTATSVGAGQKIYTVVNGDIYINQNINFASNWSNNVDRIPSYYLVAKGGNIYISNAVTRLDGVFIAQPESGTGGKIYTCYNTNPAGQGAIPAADLYKTAANGGCRNKLTVNGAFVADQVRFLRTQGTVNNAPRTTQLGLQWSFVGQIPNKDCTQVYEAAEPPSHTWTDNYLCVTPGKNLGFEWSQAGPIPGKNCLRWNVPGEPAVYTWADNYLCWAAGKSLGLTFSATGPDASKFCTQIVENSDPEWGSNNYLCEPKASGPETSGSNNIAEVINFSPETYLANPDSALQKGTLGSGYDYITSLSPIL